MRTKNTNQIWVNQDFFNNIAKDQFSKRLNEASKILNEYLAKLNDELNILSSQWIKIDGKDIFYIDKFKILMPDITVFQCSVANEEHFNNIFNGYEGRIISEEEAYELFYINRSTNKFLIDSVWFTSYGSNRCVVRYQIAEGNGYECINTQGNRSCCYKNLHNNCPSCSWGYGIKLPVYDLRKCTAAENLITYGLMPEQASSAVKSMIHAFHELYAAGYIFFNNNNIYFTEKFSDEVMNNRIDELFGISFRKADITEDLREFSQNNIINLSEDFIKKYKQNLLNCDNIRAEIEEYDEQRLSDPNQGMWELWENEAEKPGYIKIQTNINMVGRNPVSDICEDGIVGIDFGTKSTIIVYQNGNDNIMPMRIGMGCMSAPIKPEQYENPTVMEIKNLENFLRAYSSKEGRPETEWADITVSHTAHRNMTSSKVSDDFYSYLYDLKQWSADPDRHHIVAVKDQCGNEYELQPYMSDNNNRFDPIEIYAYYLGTYINNIRNGIYLDYLISFPITYEKELKEKLLNSFRKGIKKSLPQSVINDKYCMDIFSVQSGVSESVAYAITAFTEFGLKPGLQEEMLYGVFDFGGGTTDFNFGSYRRADISEKKRYDYVITHVGSGGDKYLGGENLLELLAFEIFKANFKKLLKRNDGAHNFKGIEFSMPLGCDIFLGSETLISESQKAKRNTKQLMEKLRPYWENLDYEYKSGLSDDNSLHRSPRRNFDDAAERVIDNINRGFIKVDLFDNSGQLIKDFVLDICNHENGVNLNLASILEVRIDKGVRQFFNALKSSFSYKQLATNGIEIFLSGNSGKSPILRKLFDIHTKKYLESEAHSENTSLFRIYPSLGTPEAVAIQKRNGIATMPGELYGPTGKTGVAYGLIKGRTGSRIKVVSEIEERNEIMFNYFLGHCEDGNFICDISSDVKNGIWTPFSTADVPRLEMYYTDLPEAVSNNMPVSNIPKKILRIREINNEAFVYVRKISPSVAEYVVAYHGRVDKGDYLSEVCRIEF